MTDHLVLFLVILVSVLAQTAAAWLALRQMGGVQGAYRLAFIVALAFSVLGAASIWFASPGKVRMVAGRAKV